MRAGCLASTCAASKGCILFLLTSRHVAFPMASTPQEGLVAGIRGVEWDAVELPSQFMENWCCECQGVQLPCCLDVCQASILFF